MKVMNRLTSIATDFFNLHKNEIDAQNRQLIEEFIECGEEGIAVDYLMRWSIDNNVVMSEAMWTELSQYLAPSETESSLVTKRLLAQIVHAA